ncbi:UNVERIFIED_CONTAM: putative ribonuclease H protein [Sesamum radiatum]|uniref:Ribonuclease H protein n=1 Tax=Sesamum radiatum TaxID=300843 RepID=A0AAW2W951_SESRA
MPELEWVKLNSDGASRGNPGVSGVGGIIRDHFGQVILAYYEPLGFSTNMMAELQGLFRGLQLCLERGLFHVWIDVDAMHVIRLIAKQSKGAWHLQTLLNRIRKSTCPF